MKQLSFLNIKHTEENITERSSDYWKLYIDGAARNNPGPAGAGVYITKNDTIEMKKQFYLGIKTNNQAEYLALLLGLCSVQEKIASSDLLHIMSDSQLLVRKIRGEYKVKDQTLQLLHLVAQKLLKNFNYAIDHLVREENTQADALANQAIDYQVPIPETYKKLLQKYEIIFD
jgi:ribonuclease HI